MGWALVELPGAVGEELGARTVAIRADGFAFQIVVADAVGILVERLLAAVTGVVVVRLAVACTVRRGIEGGAIVQVLTHVLTAPFGRAAAGGRQGREGRHDQARLGGTHGRLS